MNRLHNYQGTLWIDQEMMNVNRIIKTLICPAIFLLLLWQPTSANADSERELRDAVTSLNSWLGGNDKARGWRQFLALNILDTQSALGHRADPALLNDILQRFNQDVEGLDHPAFNRVRYCIKSHLEQLARTPTDIRYSAAEAQLQYRRAKMEDLDVIREGAIFNIKMMKRFYKKRLSSRPRAELYYMLKPDKLVDFLETMKFEVSPQRTINDVQEEIGDVETKIKMIEEQAEQLNEQREKINEWLEELKDKGGRDENNPPMPDSETITVSEALAPEGETGSAGNPRSSELQENETSKELLFNKKETLEEKLTELRAELEEIEIQEKERRLRFRETLKTYNEFLDPYEEQRALRNDVYFAQTFEGLGRLKAAFLAAANPRTEASFDERMEEFPELFELLATDNDRRAAAEIGNMTGWFEGAGQVPDLVAAVRRQYSLPNLHFELSDYLVNQFAGRSTDEVRRVNEQILSRLIRGIAFVNGNVSVQFVPDSNQARASIDLTGGIESHTYTRSGKFTAYAGANGSFNARRDLFANIGGMFACDPYGDLALGSYFKGIDSSCDLVQRLAVKGYKKTKFRSEAISRKNTKEELFEKFEAETSEALSQGFDRFEDFTKTQTDTSQLLPSLYMFTTANRLVIKGHRATQYDLAATKGPQFFNQVPAYVHAKVHESMLSNYASPLLAGRRLSNTEIAETFRELLGREAESEEDSDEEAEEFSIQFAEARPIQIEFEGNKLAVTIIGDEFIRDRTRIRNALKIRLAFRIERGPESLQVVPDGEVSVELVDPLKTNIQTVTFKNFLEDRLSEVLAKAESNTVEIPANLIPVDRIEGEQASEIANSLELVQFRLDDGWLYAGWKYLPDNSLFHGATDTPAIWYPMVEAAPTLDTLEFEGEVELDSQDPLDELSGDAESN